ncbi:MAG: hydrolase, alpha [Alphaproteobacteria bacterium]|nr:hydrolase, alpha [Alphaproteobacteria bacterium]
MIRILALLMLPLLGLFAGTADAAPFHSDRISVEMRGSGPDVVLIPGLSSSPKVWEGSVAAVPGYRYHLVHVAGFDGAAPGANASGPVVAPVAEEIARYIREKKLNRPALVGHSLGGTWAMMIAARHPELASKVMVVDMMPYLGAMFAPPGAAPDAVRTTAEQIRTAIAGGRGEQRRQSIEQTIAAMVKTESQRAGPIAQSLASDPAVSGQAMYEIITTDLRPELANIKVPLIVLWVVPANAPVTVAQLDQFYRLSYAKAPQAVLKNIPDSYHFIMLDQPAVFARELRAFLKP